MCSTTVQDSCFQAIGGMYLGFAGAFAGAAAQQPWALASGAASVGMGLTSIAEGSCHGGESSFDQEVLLVRRATKGSFAAALLGTIALVWSTLYFQEPALTAVAACIALVGTAIHASRVDW